MTHVNIHPIYQAQGSEPNELEKKILAQAYGRLVILIQAGHVSPGDQEKQFKAILLDIFRNNHFSSPADRVQVEKENKLLLNEITVLNAQEEVLQTKIQELVQKLENFREANQRLSGELDKYKRDKEILNAKQLKLIDNLKKFKTEKNLLVNDVNTLTEDRKYLNEKLKLLDLEVKIIRQLQMKSEEKNDDLENKLSKLTKNKDDLLEEKKAMQQKCEELKKQLFRLLEVSSEEIKKEQQLKEKYDQLQHNLASLDQDDQLLQEEVDKVLEKNNQLLEQEDLQPYEKLQAAFDLLNQKCQSFEEKLEEIEVEKSKEDHNNRLDELGNIATGIAFMTGAVASGGLVIPAVVVAGGVYGFYKSGKYYINYKFHKELETYQAAHLKASKKEVLDAVLKIRRNALSQEDIVHHNQV